MAPTPGPGKDVFESGQGVDVVDYSSRPSSGADIPEPGPVFVNLALNQGQSEATGLDVLRAIEAVFGTLGADSLIGGAGADKLAGYVGDDHIEGRGGDDALYGFTGNDFLDGGEGTDLLDGGDDADTCVFGETLLNCEA
jgi:Ca2+-binding RTX toxin-like protein